MTAVAPETPGPVSPVVRGWLIALAAVLLAAFVLRAAYHRQPYEMSDEDITMKVVGHLRQSGDWDTNWAKADLPAELRYDQYNFSSHLFATYFFYRFMKLLPGTEAWRSAEGGRWVYRFFSVLLATLVVAQTMRVAHRAGGSGAALGAGALAAVATQLVQDAHFMRPEPFTTVLTLAAVACCWPRERLSFGWLATGSLAIGLAVACKVSLLLIAWLPLVPVVASWRQSPRPWVALVVIPAAIALGFALGVPGALSHPAQYLHGVQHLMTQYRTGHPPHSHLNGGPVMDLLAGFYTATLGWPLLAAAALGASGLAGRRRWAELALLAGPVVIFAGYFSTQQVFFERNLSHVVPLLLVLAALGAGEFARRLGGQRGAVTWMAALVMLIGVRPAQLTAALVGTEFSGRGTEVIARLDEAVLAQHPGAVLLAKELLVAPDLAPIAEHFQKSRAPLLLRVCDYHDDWTAASLQQLTTHYDAKLVAGHAGSFPDVPTSTLVVYHSWFNRYYLIKGPRTK